MDLVVIETKPKLTATGDEGVGSGDKGVGRVDDRICQGTEPNPVHFLKVVNLHQDGKDIQGQHRNLNPLKGQRFTDMGHPLDRVSAPDKKDKRSGEGGRLIGIDRHFPCDHLQSHLTSPG